MSLASLCPIAPQIPRVHASEIVPIQHRTTEAREKERENEGKKGGDARRDHLCSPLRLRPPDFCVLTWLRSLRDFWCSDARLLRTTSCECAIIMKFLPRRFSALVVECAFESSFLWR